MTIKKAILAVAAVLLLGVASLTAAARANSPASAPEEQSDAIAKEVLQLEEAGRQKALSGDANWDDLISEGAYMIAFDGSIIHYQKGTRLPAVPLKSFKLSEMIARVYGEVVVVTGLAEVGSETADKKLFSFQMRFLNVWKKSADGWQIVVSERTGVKPPPK